MQFDIFTIMTASCAVILVSGLLIFLHWLRDRSAKWLAVWGAAFAMLGLGNILVMSRPALPDTISAALGTSCLISGFWLIWQAARIFERRSIVLWPLVVSIVVWLVLFHVPYIRANLGVRIAISSVPMAGGLLLAAWELWRGRAEKLASRDVVINVLGLVGVVFAGRVPLSPIAPYPVGGQPVDALTVTLFNGMMFISAIVLAVSLISMTRERSEMGQRELALSDPLTGLPNRRAMEQAFSGGILPAGTSVIAFDLDHFKMINDSFGHDAGDRVLCAFTQICRENTRQVDLAVRLGGEEFVILLPNTDQAAAVIVADRIRTSLAQTVVEIDDGAVACTVSAGVSAVASVEVLLEDALKSADIQMYRAKDAGRNRVNCSADAFPPRKVA